MLNNLDALLDEIDIAEESLDSEKELLSKTSDSQKKYPYIELQFSDKFCKPVFNSLMECVLTDEQKVHVDLCDLVDMEIAVTTQGKTERMSFGTIDLNFFANSYTVIKPYCDDIIYHHSKDLSYSGDLITVCFPFYNYEL